MTEILHRHCICSASVNFTIWLGFIVSLLIAVAYNSTPLLSAYLHKNLQQLSHFTLPWDQVLFAGVEDWKVSLRRHNTRHHSFSLCIRSLMSGLMSFPILDVLSRVCSNYKSKPKVMQVFCHYTTILYIFTFTPSWSKCYLDLILKRLLLCNFCTLLTKPHNNHTHKAPVNVWQLSQKKKARTLYKFSVVV